MYKIGTSEDLWYCREKYPDVFLDNFKRNSLKPLGHATVCRHIEQRINDHASPLNILEVGHGALSPTFEVFKDQKSINLFGIDDYNPDITVSSVALNRLRNRYKNATFFSGYVGNDTSPELPSNFFDLVYSVSVIEHLPVDDLPTFHSELHRIIKPGGLQVHSYDRPWGGDIMAMKDAIETSGFKWVDHPITKDFWQLDINRIRRVVFEHPFNVMDSFMYKMPRENRLLCNWATVIIKAKKV